MLQIRLLGPLEIERDSRPVEIGGQKVCGGIDDLTELAEDRAAQLSPR